MPDLFFFEDALNQLLVIFCGAEPGKYLHHVVDLLLFFGSGLIESALLLEIQQFSADHEFFASDPLSQLVVVDIDESKLHLLLFLTVVVVELHLGKQQFRIIVVLDLKIASFGHVAHDFSRVGAGLDAICHLVHRQRSSFCFR